MALETQEVPISFQQGVDTKTDAKQVVPGKLLTLENGVFSQTKSIKKRDGNIGLSRTRFDGGSLTVSRGLSTYKNELVQLNGSSLLSYSESADKWSTASGTLTPIAMETNSIYQDSYLQDRQDSAYDSVSGLQCFVWRGANTVGSVMASLNYSIIDYVSGQSIVSNGLVDANLGVHSANAAKVVFDGTIFVIVYSDNAGSLWFMTIDPATPTVISAATLIKNDGVAPYRFDIAVIDAKVYIAYQAFTGTNQIGMLTITAGTASAVTYMNGSALRCLTIFGTDGTNLIWIAWGSGTEARFTARNGALGVAVIASTQILANINVQNITGVPVSGSSPAAANVYIEFDDGADIYENNMNGYRVAAAGVTGRNITHCLGLASKVFHAAGADYMWAQYKSYQQPTYFLVKVSPSTNAVAIAKLAPTVAGGNNAVLDGFYGVDYGFLSSVNLIGTDLQFAYLEENALYNSILGEVIAYGVKSLVFSYSMTASTVESANNLMLTGGMVNMFDGAALVEHGFNMFPEAISATQTAGTGFVAAGTYQYLAVYEWTDLQGQKHQSAPGPNEPLTVVVAGALSTVHVTVSCLRLTQKANVKVTLYRTTAAGTVFYLQSNTTLNVANAFTVTINDIATDNEIAAQGPIYTAGGEVDNFPAPAPAAMFTYKNRVIVIPRETPNTFWYSKAVLPDTPVEFSSLFTQNIDQKGGGVQAGIQLDDKMILFKPESIFVQVGDGPSPSGAGNDFGPVQEVASDSGTSNPASVVLTPMGIMYQSSKGIYLLDRSLSVSYIGQDVEAYNGDTVTSARLLPKLNQVRFTLDSGVCLMFDYLVKQWSVFTNCAAIAATIYQDKFCFVDTSAHVFKETPGVYTDNGSFIQLKLITSWLSFAGLQAYQRVYNVLILGDYKSAHTLRVQVAHDFIDTVTQTDDIIASNTPPYQYRIDLAQQKSQAVQLTIEDVQSSAFGEGLDLSAMTFEIGIKRGHNKVGPSATYG